MKRSTTFCSFVFVTDIEPVATSPCFTIDEEEAMYNLRIMLSVSLGLKDTFKPDRVFW